MGARSQITFLIALTLATYLGSAFGPSLLDGPDSVHAEAAREILGRDDCVTPHVNGIRYLGNGAATLLGVPTYWPSELATRRSRVASLITTQVTTMLVPTTSTSSAPRPVMKCQTASP